MPNRISCNGNGQPPNDGCRDGESTLATGIDSTTTEIRVVNVNAQGESFIEGKLNPGVEPGQLQIQGEIITYTGINVNTNTFTGCTRGTSSTTPSAHLQGQQVVELTSRCDCLARYTTASQCASQRDPCATLDELLTLAINNRAPALVLFLEGGHRVNASPGIVESGVLYQLIRATSLST